MVTSIGFSADCFHIFLFFLFQMIVTEIMNASPYEQPIIFRGYKIPVWMWESYCVIGVFAFGCAAQQLTTDIMKYSIGRLRPHFYTVCRPNYNCTPYSLDYITDFTCTNPEYINNKRIMKEMR